MAEGVGHVLGANVGNALQGEADVDWVAARQIILDGLDDELHQLAVSTDQHRDEQVALETRTCPIDPNVRSRERSQPHNE